MGEKRRTILACSQAYANRTRLPLYTEVYEASMLYPDLSVFDGNQEDVVRQASTDRGLVLAYTRTYSAAFVPLNYWLSAECSS